MKLIFCLVALALLQHSCTRKTVTDKQEQQFNACKGPAIEMYRKLPLKQMIASERDSAIMLANDLSGLSLEEFVEKYKIKEGQVDEFIQSLCLSSEMDESIQEINQKMKESDLDLDTSVQNALVRDSVKKKGLQ